MIATLKEIFNILFRHAERVVCLLVEIPPDIIEKVLWHIVAEAIVDNLDVRGHSHMRFPSEPLPRHGNRHVLHNLYRQRRPTSLIASFLGGALRHVVACWLGCGSMC